ncbi:4-hydroxy-3-methylbut-2-enyl diphosphate reductase [Peptacetobacter sp. AB845]|uniref:4-hydroxy-3-methylbut-2-enyl diphosphate reductase n=1 Tax=Peptacetobacter sp. AB845 TaxID=3388429 RepID=UPI0039C980DF
MNIKISEKAGFCFGVKRAMGLAWRELCDEHDKQTYALGPLIHNKQAVEKYEERGLITVDDIEEIPSDVKMIIRSHGVSKSIYDRTEEKGLDVVDTTCPFVKKIHDIVKENYDTGKKIILIGDKNHPEVIGINGWCKNTAITIKTIEEAEVLELNNDKSYCAVAQTTMNLEVYRKIVEILKTKADDIEFNNTICSSTKARQEAARELASEMDCMIVIGGKHSSNTQKLVGICKEVCPTFAIETRDDLDVEEIKKYENVGITAGASTPDWIIDDIIEFLKSL